MKKFEFNPKLEELSDRISQSVVVATDLDKPNMVALLKKNGSLVTELSPNSEIKLASIQAIKESPNFRRDFAEYIKRTINLGSSTISNILPNRRKVSKRQSLNNLSEGKNFANYVSDDFFANGTGEGWKKVSQALGKVFTEENIQALTSAGIGYASARLQDSATKKGNAQAIAYEKAKAEAALAQAQANATTPTTPTDSKGGKKWVLPVVIGGVVVLGVVVFLVAKRKK